MPGHLRRRARSPADHRRPLPGELGEHRDQSVAGRRLAEAPGGRPGAQPHFEQARGLHFFDLDELEQTLDQGIGRVIVEDEGVDRDYVNDLLINNAATFFGFEPLAG